MVIGGHLYATGYYLYGTWVGGRCKYIPGSIQIPTRYYPGTIEIVPGRIQMTTDYDTPIDWSCYPVPTCIYLSIHQ
ncbi:unnamed protein product [Caenorhabditis auriculariae]|uniref:Uncharacterized protein n=1 Tax=Caenorhabditis auriculariae TaxID=2777116 RepID=A0A8S1GX80_9PELO|nr:unnamed protein product [Caenorhabditis auriculariae]